MEQSVRNMTFKLNFGVIAIILSLMFYSTAIAESNILPCENRPFDSSSERAEVKKDNPDCYELRNSYQELVPDSKPLQDISQFRQQEILQLLAELLNQVQILQTKLNQLRLNR